MSPWGADLGALSYRYQQQEAHPLPPFLPRGQGQWLSSCAGWPAGPASSPKDTREHLFAHLCFLAPSLTSHSAPTRDEPRYFSGYVKEGLTQVYNFWTLTDLDESVLP